MAPRYWRRTLTLTLALLLAWLLVTLLAVLGGTLLDFELFGWPAGFWFGAQGALLLFLLIVWVYAWRMDVLERESGAAGDDG